MVNEAYDVIVVGLGAMGSATTYQVAKRGAKVLGLEMFQPGHDQGSSHGYHRMIRKSSFQDDLYVPLAARAFELWREVEEESGQTLLRILGEISIVDPDSQPAYHAAVRKMIAQGMRTVLDRQDLAERFPGVRYNDGMLTTYEADAGFLRSEAGILTHLDLARRHGATVQTNTEVLAWSATANGVQVETTQGTFHAASVILTAGPWAAELLASLGLPLQVKRSVNGFFQPERPDLWRAQNGAPDFLLDVPEGSFYGMPAVDDVGLKIGLSNYTATTARTIRRTIDAEEIDRLRQALDTYLPGASGPLVRQITCMCTYTPDGDFVIDHHPDHEQVILGCGFSGRGFKFAPTVGEILADLALEGRTRHEIAALSPRRFAALAAD